jgi:hypothetical protein
MRAYVACAIAGLIGGAGLAFVWLAQPVRLALWVQAQREAARCEADQR